MSKRRLFITREHGTARFTSVLKDDTDAVIPAADLTSLTLTLYLKSDASQKINSRNAQNILNANNVTVDSSGNLVWSMQAADNVIVDQSLEKEAHIALFEYSWNSGAKQDSDQIEIQVRRVVNVASL